MIYLDHHAATPLCAEAEGAMRAALEDGWANASSTHAAGRAAKVYVERARRAVAEALGGAASDIVLTSGGTEACNLMVLGVSRPTMVVVSALEHPAVTESAAVWRDQGVDVVTLRRPTPDALAKAVRPGGLVCLQWVNHETGAVTDIEACARITRDADCTFVVDATQAFGRLPIDVSSLGVDSLAVASHKAGGPSGAGALWVRRELALQPHIRGGGQERGRRGGTQDAVTLAGFAAACEQLDRRLGQMTTLEGWRDRLETALVDLGGVVNGGEGRRVASVSNTSHRHWKGEVLVAALDVEGVCTSAGAACSSGVAGPSPVLTSLYSDEPWRAASSLRVSVGPEGLSDAAVDEAIEVLGRVLSRGAKGKAR